MQQHPGLQQGFRIGDFEVRPLANQLRTGYRKVEVSRPAMQLLVELAGHPGELVPADALRKTLRVDASTLGRSWAELRRVLGDHGAAPQFLKQEGTKGFLLISDVLIDRPPIPTREQILGPDGQVT